MVLKRPLYAPVIVFVFAALVLLGCKKEDNVLASKKIEYNEIYPIDFIDFGDQEPFDWGMWVNNGEKNKKGHIYLSAITSIFDEQLNIIDNKVSLVYLDAYKGLLCREIADLNQGYSSVHVSKDLEYRAYVGGKTGVNDLELFKNGSCRALWTLSLDVELGVFDSEQWWAPNEYIHVGDNHFFFGKFKDNGLEATWMIKVNEKGDILQKDTLLGFSAYKFYEANGGFNLLGPKTIYVTYFDYIFVDHDLRKSGQLKSTDVELNNHGHLNELINRDLMNIDVYGSGLIITKFSPNGLLIFQKSVDFGIGGWPGISVSNNGGLLLTYGKELIEINSEAEITRQTTMDVPVSGAAFELENDDLLFIGGYSHPGKGRRFAMYRTTWK